MVKGSTFKRLDTEQPIKWAVVASDQCDQKKNRQMSMKVA